ELDDYQGIIRGLMNLSLSLKANGRYAEAVETAQEALQRMEERGDTSWRGWIVGLNTLGAVYRVLGERRLADDTFDRALTCANAIGDLLGESLALTNRSIGHGQQREWKEAAEKLERNVEI